MYSIIDFFRKCYQDYSSLSFHDKKPYAYQLYPFLSQLVLGIIIFVWICFSEMVLPPITTPQGQLLLKSPAGVLLGWTFILLLGFTHIYHFVIAGYWLIKMLPKRTHRLNDMFNRISLSNAMDVSAGSTVKQRHFHAFLLFELLFTLAAILFGVMLLLMLGDPAKIFLPEKYWPVPNSLVFWIALFPYKYINIYLFLFYSYMFPFLYDWKMVTTHLTKPGLIPIEVFFVLVSAYILATNMPGYILAKFYRYARLGLALLLFCLTTFTICSFFSWDIYFQRWLGLEYISYLGTIKYTLLLQLFVMFMACTLFLPFMLYVFNLIIIVHINMIDYDGSFVTWFKPFYNFETCIVILISLFLIYIYTFVWRPFLNIVMIHLFHKIMPYYRSQKPIQ